MRTRFRNVLLLAATVICPLSAVAETQYWNIDPGGKSISWVPEQGEVHSDHLEMSGKQLSVVVRYGIAPDGTPVINRNVVWPMLRTIPNDTHGSLMRAFGRNPIADMKINGNPVRQRATSFSFDGCLKSLSDVSAPGVVGLTLEHCIFPSTSLPTLIEVFEFENKGDKTVNLELPESRETFRTDPAAGVSGSYAITVATASGGNISLAPGEKYRFYTYITGLKPEESIAEINPEEELAARHAMLASLTDNLVLETPDPVLNCMFALSKIRACESIFATKGGPMHGPGGERYYAAIWANDQAEYADPFFPFTGYDYGNQSALNSFRLFARYMNDEYRPLPSSIVAEGDTVWAGAGDRGDAAMIAYGASRYALARADREEAIELMPLIEWCLEYSRRRLNDAGVVASDHDELEGRFPAGDANLCTSSLYYDALLSTAWLAEELNYDRKVADKYRREAAELRKNIDRYFTADVEGYPTYAYFKGNDVLRAWICIPLAVGIDERAAGTLDALFSPRLWTENGLLTQAGTETFWDRSTLYALRGAYAVGEHSRTTDFLKHFSRRRLLGEHVPYVVEAWPEGNQRHLSAESALYARVFTEGLFGIRPIGFKRFTLRPQLPIEWDEMSLRHIRAFGKDFDITASRVKGDRINVKISDDTRTLLNRTIRDGASIEVNL